MKFNYTDRITEAPKFDPRNISDSGAGMSEEEAVNLANLYCI